MRSSHRSQAHPDTRLGPAPCSHACGNRLRPAVLTYPTTCLYAMIDDSAAHNRISSAPTSEVDSASASEQTENADGARGQRELIDRMQMCARELVQLLHRMPMASRRKQSAIRLLVKVIRLATPDGVQPATTADGTASTPADSNHVARNGTVSTGSSRADSSGRSESLPDRSDVSSDGHESSTNRPPFPQRRLVGL